MKENHHMASDNSGRQFSCPRCGAEVRVGMVRCRSCGEYLSSPGADSPTELTVLLTDSELQSQSQVPRVPAIAPTVRPRPRDDIGLKMHCDRCGAEMRRGMLRCRECGQSARLKHNTPTETCVRGSVSEQACADSKLSSDEIPTDALWQQPVGVQMEPLSS